jgi:hypothetical protein
MVLLDDEPQVVARFSLFGDNANLDRDTCMLCAERTNGSEIISDAPNVELADLGHVESCFGLFGGSVIVGAR